MRFLRCSEASQRCDLGISYCGDRSNAGTRGLSVELDGARTALCESAAKMRVVETEIIAQRIEQRHVGIGVYRVRRAVDRECKLLGHSVQLPEPIVKPQAHGRRPLLRMRLLSTLAEQRLVPPSGFGN